MRSMHQVSLKQKRL